MTHFNILTGVNRIFDDLEAFFQYVCVCVCVCTPAIALMCVCLRGSRQPSPDPLSVLLSRAHPSLPDRSDAVLVRRANCCFYRGAPQPLGRAGDCCSGIFFFFFSPPLPKPFKAAFTREWEEAFECVRGGEGADRQQRRV